MTRYSDFVKDYATKKKLSWNCAVCEIKTNGLYTPAPKTRKEPKKKNSTNKKVSEPFKRTTAREKEQRNIEREMNDMGMEDINILPKPQLEKVRHETKKEWKLYLLEKDKAREKDKKIFFMNKEKLLKKLKLEADKDIKSYEDGKKTFDEVYFKKDSPVNLFEGMKEVYRVGHLPHQENLFTSNKELEIRGITDLSVIYKPEYNKLLLQEEEKKRQKKRKEGRENQRIIREREQMGMEDVNVRVVEKKRTRYDKEIELYLKENPDFQQIMDEADRDKKLYEEGKLSYYDYRLKKNSAGHIRDIVEDAIYENRETGNWGDFTLRTPKLKIADLKKIMNKEQEEIEKGWKEIRKNRIEREQMGMEDINVSKKNKGKIISIEDFKNKNVKALSPAVVEYLMKKKRPAEEISKFTKNFTLNKFTNYVLRNKVDLEDVANLYNDEVDRILTKMSNDKTQFKFHLFLNLWKSKINTDNFIKSEIQRKKRIVEEKRQEDIERERLSKIPITMYSRNSSKI